MEFGNPIVGSEDLIREAIKSPNFNTDPESGNVTGWRVARDGSATFYNLTIGSTSFNIDQEGNAVFQSVSANEIFLNGENLGDILTTIPGGTIAVVTSTTDTATYAGTPVQFNAIKIPDFDGTRQYEVGICGRLNMDNFTGDYYGVRALYAWDADPTTSSPKLFEMQTGGVDGPSDWEFNGTFTFSNSTPAGTEFRIAFYFYTSQSGFGNYQGEDWARAWVKDAGIAADVSTWTPSTPPVQQYTKTYTAQWSESYQGDGSSRGSFDNGHCFQGYYSSTNGNQFSLVGLPETTIAADITGATIVKTEIYLDNQHFYSNGGGTVYVGTHEYASAPGTASLSNVRERLDSESFDYGQAKWFTVTNTIATDFLNNNAKGIAIGPGPSNSQSYYSYFSGAGESNPPKLRITYKK